MLEKDATLSFARDIRPLLRDMDVDEMKPLGIDLSNYEEVKAKAETVYARILDKSMPCDGPWPDEQIAKFKEWMNQGMQP